jgi:hypothetical protein
MKKGFSCQKLSNKMLYKTCTLNCVTVQEKSSITLNCLPKIYEKHNHFLHLYSFIYSKKSVALLILISHFKLSIIILVYQKKAQTVNLGFLKFSQINPLKDRKKYNIYSFIIKIYFPQFTN